MWLLVGLGNPGPKYAGHRHNIGFMAVDAIVRRHRFSAPKKRFHGVTWEGQIPTNTGGLMKVLALTPHTFMNESGRAVGDAVRFYKIDLTNVVVFYDELDLLPGKVRVKKGGGAGGHNGIRSIDAHCGKDYWRVRMGIGHPGRKELVAGYVLHDFAKGDRDWLDPLLDAVADDTGLLLTGGADKFMTKLALAAPSPS